jgi:hypothetical protein
MSNLLAKFNLKSPVWQGVGAIVSIAALVISTFITYDIYQKSSPFSELTIEQGYSFNPIAFGENAKKRISMSVDGENVQDVQVYYFRINNTGKAPILPTDYIEPLKISTQKPFRIIAIEKQSAKPQDLTVDWNRINTEAFQIKPMLLNPGDSFGTLVFVSQEPAPVVKGNKIDLKKDKSSSDKSSDYIRGQVHSIQWKARIVNISNLKLTNYQDPHREEMDKLGIFYVRFQTSGWGIYTYSIFSLILFLLGLFLGVQFGILKQGSLRYYILLSSLMGLSVVSGATLSDRFHGATNEHWMCNVALVLYALLVFFFTTPAFKSLKNKKTN